MKFDETLYQGEGHEYDGSFGMQYYDSNKERWYITINGYKVYSDIWVDMPSGKYLLAIKGFVKKERIDTNVNKRAVNYGYQLELVRVDNFDGFKNPRENEYNFNIGSAPR